LILRLAYKKRTSSEHPEVNLRNRSESVESTNAPLNTPAVDYSSDTDGYHQGSLRGNNLQINEIEILPDEPTLTVHVIIKNWTLSVTIPERVTVEQLKLEVSRRATKKMTTIEEKLQRGKNAINQQLDTLYEAISNVLFFDYKKFN
jgi:hypothetical protein